jgi:hypothetical protein
LFRTLPLYFRTLPDSLKHFVSALRRHCASELKLWTEFRAYCGDPSFGQFPELLCARISPSQQSLRVKHPSLCRKDALCFIEALFRKYDPKPLW